MKNRSKFIIGLVSLVLTIGILGATLGKPCYLKNIKDCAIEKNK